MYVLDAVFWILGIRGDHIPQSADFGAAPSQSPLDRQAIRIVRGLTAFIVAIAFLSLVLRAAVWLALKLL